MLAYKFCPWAANPFLRGASIMLIEVLIPQGKWNSIFPSNRANQEVSDSIFLFPFPYITEEKQGSEPVGQKWNNKFQPDWLEETKMDLSTRILTVISGMFGIMENTRSLNNNNNNNKIFITVSMYLAHRANWGHLLLQN